MNLDTYLVFLEIICVADSICMDFTVFQLYAGCNLIHICFCQVLVQMNMIYFLFQEFRVCQLGSQVTVICQQKYTSRVAVKTPYRINAFVASAFYQIHYRAAFLRIIRCSNRIFRLIQQYVYLTFDAYRFIVELHHIRAFDLCTQFSYYFTVYRNHTCCDKLISFAT